MPEKTLLKTIAVLAAALLSIEAHAGRALSAQDWYRFQPVSDLQIAPDGTQVAYLVTSFDKASDESRAALWSVGWSGGAPAALTHGQDVSDPRFSHDGRYLSYLAAPSAGADTQLWLLDRHGGEARQVTHVSGEITSYEWSPDGVHAVLVMRAGSTAGAKEAQEKEKETPGKDNDARPIVIDAYQFKQDKDGYLTAGSRTHLYLLDVRSGAVSALTADPQREDSDPAFSPDGHAIGYVSHLIGGPADAGRDDICLIATAPAAKPRRLLWTWSPNKQRLEFSPDGKLLAFLQGDEPKFNAYITDRLAVADLKSGQVRVLAQSLDRAVFAPKFTADGAAIMFTVEDDGYQYPAEVNLKSGAVEQLANAIVAHELVSAAGHTAVLASSDATPPEVYALEQGKLRALTTYNAALFGELTLGTVEDISFASADGTQVHGQIVKPPGFVAGRRYPTILWIHGGPNGQDDHSLELWGYGPPLERQLFATHGYVVLAINYRGGTGRGAQYARTIAADWGDQEVADLLAGVDYAIEKGIADPQRLGVGGWSYGGLLTDYTIATDTRFKAAISGAGSGNQTAMYGVDEYVMQYNAELGPPWRNTELWMKLSYPFFHADRIRTPTLFLGGDKDFNVPLAGGEQMYQALKTLGIPAQLIIYPGEYHVLTRPSFLVDRSQRYLEWMDKYLKAGP